MKHHTEKTARSLHLLRIRREGTTQWHVAKHSQAHTAQHDKKGKIIKMKDMYYKGKTKKPLV